MRYAFWALVTLAITTTSAPAQGWAEKMFKGGLNHDFGTVPRGAQLIHRFPITNIYAVRMEITNVKSGCGCVTATAEKRVLEPRETSYIEVRMDGRRFAGAKTVGIRVTVGPEYISSAELKVVANARADIVFNPGEVNFGTVTRGQTPTQSVDVEYAGALAFQVSEVVAKDVPYSVTFKENYRQPGRVGYKLLVTLKPDTPVGAQKHEVFLKTNDPASPLVPVLVEANVQSSVTVTPSLLALGAVKTDTPLIRRVVVRGNRPFRITGVDGMGTGIELGAPLSEKDEAIQFVTFKCQFGAPGSFQRELKVRTTIQEDPVTVVIEGTAAK
ncbi:MAG: DUF1573 domain-containing protein [Gemmataceae bacterium]